MDQIFYIFILFALLFLIESKAINILIAFVGLIVTLAIQLANNKVLLDINGEYISYILILVQVSALTILFGFIIMLYPKLSLIPQNKITLDNLEQKNTKIYTICKYIIVSLLILSMSYYIKINRNIPNNLILEINTYTNWLDTVTSSDTELLRKIGANLYSEDNNIIKLILLTTILLVAIIILFFLVSL